MAKCRKDMIEITKESKALIDYINKHRAIINISKVCRTVEADSSNLSIGLKRLSQGESIDELTTKQRIVILAIKKAIHQKLKELRNAGVPNS